MGHKSSEKRKSGKSYKRTFIPSWRGEEIPEARNEY